MATTSRKAGIQRKVHCWYSRPRKTKSVLLPELSSYLRFVYFYFRGRVGFANRTHLPHQDYAPFSNLIFLFLPLEQQNQLTAHRVEVVLQIPEPVWVHGGVCARGRSVSSHRDVEAALHLFQHHFPQLQRQSRLVHMNLVPHSATSIPGEIWPTRSDIGNNYYCQE